MKNSGWAVIVIMAIIIISCAPGWIFYGGILLMLAWHWNKSKESVSTGEEQKSLSKLIDDLFVGRDDD